MVAFVALAIIVTIWDYGYRGAEDPSPPSRLARAVVAPLAGRLSASGRVVPDYALSFWDARALARENQRLQEQVDDLQAQLQAQVKDYLERQQLEKDVPLEQRASSLIARVIVWPSGNNPAKRIKIAAVGPGLIYKSDVVLQGTGLLGRVDETDGRTADVALLTDEKQYVSALIQRTSHFGIVCGDRQRLDTPYGRLEMRDFVPGADVRVNDTIVSSGDGGVYPAGLIIGEVEAVRHTSPSDPSLIAIIRPRADFRHLAFVRVARHRG